MTNNEKKLLKAMVGAVEEFINASVPWSEHEGDVLNYKEAEQELREALNDLLIAANKGV